jgi:carboxyl-terminal processing protease
MNDKNTKNNIGSASEGNQSNRKATSGGRGKFFLRSLPLILLLMIMLPISSSVAENIKCSRLPLLMGSFLSNHYAMKSMTEEIKIHAVDQMIKRMDPSKTLLYESDVERLTAILKNVFEKMQAGDCSSLRPVYDILVARARENEVMVKEILGLNYKIDETVELQVDVKKRPFVTTREEKKELLRKVVQFQIENELLAGMNLAEAKKQQIHHYELYTKRVIKRNPEKLIITAAEAFAQALDPHTNYLSTENLEDMRIHMKLSLEGIGALLTSDNGFVIIQELIPGGSAERSGLLKPKDKIIAVAQRGERPVNVIDMELRDVVRMIRGNKGTQVTLTILRQAERTYRFDITITRDKIELKEQEAKITYETRTVDGRQYRIGIIDLPSFYGDEKESKSSYEDMKKLLAEAQRKRVDGVVLDLSRNGGGLLGEAVRITGLFLGKGGIVATKDSRGKVIIYTNGVDSSVTKGDKRKWITFPGDDSRSVYTGPLVVLTSRLSASASEIVAGALKDYRRAVIVGSDHTFGKGTVQTLSTLPQDLGGMTITTAMYFLPGGKSTQKVGVDADIQLPIFFSLEDVSETSLEYPLPSQSIAPFLRLHGSDTRLWKSVDQPLIKKLAAISRARVAKDAKFAKIIANNKEAAGKKGFIRLADLRKEMKEESGSKNETPTEMKQKAREQYAPFVNESVNVVLDMVK